MHAESGVPLALRITVLSQHFYLRCHVLNLRFFSVLKSALGEGYGQTQGSGGFFFLTHSKNKRGINKKDSFCNYSCLLFFPGDRVSLYMLAWPGICCVEQDCL